MVKEKQTSLVTMGKDEMNLVEFPITLLSRRHSSEAKTVEFSDTIDEDGRCLKREWVVTGSDKYGLPLANDNDVLLALLYLGKEQGFSSSTIHFSRYKLCKIIGWTDAGSNYRRIEETLNRLSGVRIYAKNAFWDREARMYVTANVGILDEYYIFDEGARKTNSNQEMFPLSYVKLNATLYKSIKDGYIKKISLENYFSLESAISKRLYRYLDKKCYSGKKEKFEINIFTLAFEHLGLSRNRPHISQIKQKLDPAHKELIEADFLKSAEYQKTADGISEKVIYVFSRRDESWELSAEEILRKKLLDELIGIGITQKVAEQMIKEYSGDTIRMQIKALPYREAKDPPAVLISSIHDNWAMPKMYQAQAEGQKKTRIRDQQIKEEENEKAKYRDKIKRYIGSLGKRELEEMTMQAVENAREDGGAFLKGRDIPQHLIEAYLHIIVEKKLRLS